MGDRKGLVAGAGLVAVLAVLTAVMAAAGDGGPSLPAPAATTTTIAATTTTTQPYSSGPIDVGDQWGRAALALFDHDADQVILIDLDGAEIGRGRLDGWYTNHPDRGVDLDGSGGWGVSEALPLDDPVPGCGAVHGAGGASAGMVFEVTTWRSRPPHDNLRYMYPLDAGVLWFDCGSARYHLSDWGPSDSPADHVPDRALAERAARRLVSRLYCTPGPTQFT